MQLFEQIAGGFLMLLVLPDVFLAVLYARADASERVASLLPGAFLLSFSRAGLRDPALHAGLAPCGCAHQDGVGRRGVRVVETIRRGSATR